MGHSVCQAPAQVMRLRRAALKIPAKSSVPPRSPLYKLRPLPTPSESTLPQVLIPLHFNSPRINTYKKTGREEPLFQLQSLATRHYPLAAPAHAQQHPQPLSAQAFTSQLSVYPGGWGPVFKGRSFNSSSDAHGTLATGHEPLLTTHYSLFTTHSQLTAPPYSRTDNDLRQP
jgi:hypothetical protein